MWGPFEDPFEGVFEGLSGLSGPASKRRERIRSAGGEAPVILTRASAGVYPYQVSSRRQWSRLRS